MLYSFYEKTDLAFQWKRRAGSGMTLGRERFARISAVEGIVLTPGMKERAAEFDRQGLSAAERRRAILRAYRKR